MKKTLSIEAIHHLYAGELGHALAQIDNVNDRMKAQLDDESDIGGGGKPYTIVDGIAIYKISGPLITSGSWWSRMLGYTAYDDIRSDLTAAAADPDVQEILLYMGTPGGSVFGVTDASDALTKVGALKDIYVYSSKNVASGGYWLAANCKELIGSPESEWGSIGVIVTHFSYEKQLEDDGIKVTVIKSDELKAVGGPYKDLTDKEVSHIKSQVDQYNDLFQEHVRSKRPGVRLASMKGETYIGDEALKMGLIDAVMSYDQTINYIKSKRKPVSQTGGYRMKMTAVELKTALQAGATLESLGLTEEEAAVIAASEEELNTEASTETSTETEMTSETVDVAALQEQLASAQAEALDLKGKLEAAEVAVQTAQAEAANMSEMRGIISDIINQRRVAMRLPKIDFAAFSTTSLLTDYKAISDQFDKQFVTGGLFAKKIEESKSTVQNSVHAGQLSAAA